jgi:hypothetical protein
LVELSTTNPESCNLLMKKTYFYSNLCSFRSKILFLNLEEQILIEKINNMILNIFRQ